MAIDRFDFWVNRFVFPKRGEDVACPSFVFAIGKYAFNGLNNQPKEI